MEGLAEYCQREFQVVHDHMTFLHETQLVVLRRLADKKILIPPKVVEMGYETLANNAFRLLLNELNAKFVQEQNAKQNIVSKRSLKHWLKDLFSGQDTRVKMEVKKVQDDGSRDQKIG